MSALNKVMMIGNLVRDPEVRQTGSGKTVAEMCVALDGFGRDAGGASDREGGQAPGNGKGENRTTSTGDTTFIDVVLWDRLAENASRFLGKGSGVLIEGRLQQVNWQDRQTGQNRHKIKVIAERMRFMGGPRNEGAAEPTHHASRSRPRAAASAR